MSEDIHGQTRMFSEAEVSFSYDDLPPEPLTNVGQNPVWTDNKARFIMLYLRYFVYITHHGTYIDGFAGPQARNARLTHGQRNWSLASKPRCRCHDA